MTNPYDAKSELLQALESNSILVSLCLGGIHNIVAVIPEGQPEFPRIVYQELKNSDDDYADNQATSSDVRFQLSIFNTQENISKQTSIAKEIDKTMKSIGYAKYDSIDLYDTDEKVFSKPMRYQKSLYY